MLARAFRLAARRDFKRLYRQGRRSNGRIVRLVWAKGREPQIRIGIVVATTVSKKATVRNRLRRRVREIIRARLGDLKPNHDLAIQLKPEAAQATFEDLKQDIEQQLRRAHLL